MSRKFKTQCYLALGPWTCSLLDLQILKSPLRTELESAFLPAFSGDPYKHWHWIDIVGKSEFTISTPMILRATQIWETDLKLFFLITWQDVTRISPRLCDFLFQVNSVLCSLVNFPVFSFLFTIPPSLNYSDSHPHWSCGKREFLRGRHRLKGTNTCFVVLERPNWLM